MVFSIAVATRALGRHHDVVAGEIPQPTRRDQDAAETAALSKRRLTSLKCTCLGGD